MMLYGFPTRDERDTFEALIGATGVGPKLALAILSVHSPDGAAPRRRRRRPRRARARARRRQAHRAAAARRAEGPPRGARPRPRRRRRRAAPAPRPRCATRSTGLGYAPDEVRDVLGQLAGDDGTVEDLLRDALELPGGERDDRRSGGRADERRSCCGPAADPVEAAEETTLRPRRLDEFVGQPRLQGAPRDPARRGAAARPGRRPPAVRRAARPRQDHARRDRRGGDGRRACASRAAPRSNAPATSPRSSPTSTTATCCSSTRSTGCRAPVEEVLYPAMEDFQLDIVIGKGPSARSIRLDLPALHARRRDHAHRADHRPAARPLRLRRPPRLLRRRRARRDRRAGRARSSASPLEPDGAREIAGRARGTPRIANRLLKRVRDYAEVRADGRVDRRRPPARALDAVRGRRARPRQGRPGDPRRAVRARSRASRSGSARSRSRWRRSRRRSKTSTSRSCSSGPAPAHARGAGSRPRRRTPTSALRRRRRGGRRASSTTQCGARAPTGAVTRARRRPLAIPSGRVRLAVASNRGTLMVIISSTSSLLAVAFFLLIVRPQRRQVAARRALIESLEVGRRGRSPPAGSTARSVAVDDDTASSSRSRRAW